MSRRRLAIVACAIGVYTFLLGELGLALLVLLTSEDLWLTLREDLWEAFADSVMSAEALTAMWLPAVILSMSQFAFLLPAVASRPVAATEGRSLSATLAAAALVAGMLFVGLVAGVGEAIYLVKTGKTDSLDLIWEGPLAELIDHDRWGWWPYVLAAWILWTPLLWRFCRRIPASRLHDRLAGALLAGTIAEVLVVLPLDVMVRRRSNCYCATGTFVSLVMSGLALLWLAGPAIILALTSKRRRCWDEEHCPRCGYAKGPTPGSVCPECGAAWRSDASKIEGA